MDSEIKTKWLEALRSGKYEQGRMVLRSREDKFCCLGVLCNIIDTNGWKTHDNISPSTYYFKGRNIMPSPDLLEELGISKEHSLHVAKMNDDGFSFKTIAEYIEVNL